MSIQPKHTPELWTTTDWSVTGPSAGAQFAIEWVIKEARARFDNSDAFARVCQHKAAGKKAVAITVGDTQAEADANAERIAACVNYCAGVPTENLIKVTAEGGLTRVIDQLTESVRELGKALDAARAEKAGKVSP